MREFTQMWWALLIRGIIAILFGLAAITVPQKTLLIIASLFGIFILIDGVIIAITSLISIRKIENWWILLFQGIFEFFVGIAIFSWPELTVALLFFLLALWGLFIGIMLIVTAIMTHKEHYAGWTLTASGLIAIFFSIFLLSNPTTSITLLTVLTGLFLLVTGVLEVAFSFDLHSANKDLKKLK